MGGTIGKMLGLVLALSMLPACPSLSGQETIANGPDFSSVTTKAAARRLVREGRLVQVHLFPRELGGPDDPHNIVYVTPEGADALAQIAGTIGRQLQAGLVDQMDVVPDYKGDSIIPSRITLTASHSEGPGSFEAAIEIW